MNDTPHLIRLTRSLLTLTHTAPRGSVGTVLAKYTDSEKLLVEFPSGVVWVSPGDYEIIN